MGIFHGELSVYWRVLVDLVQTAHECRVEHLQELQLRTRIFQVPCFFSFCRFGGFKNGGKGSVDDIFLLNLTTRKQEIYYILL